MSTTVPLVFNGEPHRGTPKYPGGQVAWLQAALNYRVCVIAVGRRAGKTTLLDWLDYQEGGMCTDLYQSAFVAQSHAHAEKRYEDRHREFSNAGLLIRGKNKGQDRWLEVRPWAVAGFPGNKGAVFHFWSGEEDAIDNTRGVGLHRLKIDEAGFVPEASMGALRPMVVDRQGKTIVVGTAKPEGCGFAWFRRFFYLGQPGSQRNPDYISFNAPTESNPFINPERVAKERLECLSKAEEMCEFDGLFVEDDAAVFTNLDSVFSINEFREERWAGGRLWTAEDQQPDHRYVVGLDVGMKDDWTVISVFDLMTKRQVAVGAMVGIEMHEQWPNIHRICEKYYRPLVVADARGEGVFHVERLRHLYGDRVMQIFWSDGYNTANANVKAGYVARARHLCESGGWRLLNLQVQREEFRLYMRESRKRGGYYYSAPEGLHDDYVSAAMLAGSRLQLQVPQIAKAEKEPSFWQLDEIDRRQRGRDRTAAFLRGGLY